jgi:membrane protease YdiL (CAAX protease family)
LVKDRPLSAFLVLALGTGLPALTFALLADLPAEPFLIFVSYVSLLGSAVLVTWVDLGKRGVRRLLSRLLIWRFSIGRWAVIVLGVPVLTLAVAAATGTLDRPSDGWGSAALNYVIMTVALCALINLWEETGWGGFTQSRLMARHGLLLGSLLTAPLFAAIHLPLQFMGDPTGEETLIGILTLFAVAPFYRYLLGMHLLATGGSILAIAVQHASWNSAGKLGGVDGIWQAMVAVVILTLAMALERRVRHNNSRTNGPAGEKAAAAQTVFPTAHP